MARNSREDRARMGYLAKAEIQTRINDGKLDKYDFVFAKDTEELFLIDPELNIVPVKSRFDVYLNESDATYAINHSSDTYIGQIVMVDTEEDGLKPYVVNLNESHDFYILPVMSGHIQSIVDYNLAVNTPIKNIDATIEILLDTLSDGNYNIIGMYRICNSDTTHRIATSHILFTIQHDPNNLGTVYITEFNPRRIVTYTINNSTLITDGYVLQSELENAISQYIVTHGDEVVSDYVEDNEATTEQIDSLFDTNTP